MSCGLIQQDFNPECLDGGSFLTAPTFERFPVVVDKANFFLAQNPGVVIKSCETIRHRVRKGKLLKPDALSFTQTGSQIQWHYVDGLRLWLTSPDSSDDKKVTECSSLQIGYFNVLPQCGKSSAIQDTMDTLTQKLSNQLKQHPLAGHLLAVEALEVRGVKDSEQLDPDAATGRPNPPSDSVMTFLRVWYQTDSCKTARLKVSVGLATFVPDLNLEVHKTLFTNSDYSKLRKGNVERYERVMEYVNSWREQMPQNTRILNIKSYSTRIYENGWFDCHQTFKKVPRTPTWGHLHIRFVRIFFTTSVEEDAPPMYPSVGPSITCKLFLPALLTTGGIFNRKSFEPREALLERLHKWTSLTHANVISVETVAYKAFTGEEAKFGLGVMCTGDKYYEDKHGAHPSPEVYVTAYRLFVEGVVADPPDFQWPHTVDSPKTAGSDDACSIQ